MSTTRTLDPCEEIGWKPHPGPQTIFQHCPAYETMFGGTKGPGKTDSLLREGLRQIKKPNYRAIIFRRTYPNLREVIDRSFKYFPAAGGKYNAQEHRWHFPSGAKYAFGHVNHEADKYTYQGHEYHFLGFDQVEEFTESQYLFLMAQNRTSDPTIRCYIRATANPGGVGHGWVKKRFIQVLNPYDIKYFYRDQDEDVECSASDPKGTARAFIPATVYDNPSITENDPNYIKRLEQLPEDDKQALLYGNWDIFKGQFFKDWRKAIHVREKEIKKEYVKFLSLDYGYSNPSSIGWWFVDFDGSLHRYREFYGEGLTYSQLAERVVSLTPADEKIDYCVADPAIWGDRAHHTNTKEGIKGESGAETMQKIWGDFTQLVKADNSRITGWGRMRELLKPYIDQHGQTNSRFTVDPSCKDFIRTVPILIHDLKKVEDIDSTGEDHAADEARYAVMSRPETPQSAKKVSFAQAQEIALDPFSIPKEREDDSFDLGGVSD